MSTSDATLWLQWQRKRDPDAFAELVARHSGMVYATCRRILRNAVEAEDAAQECFVELLNGRIDVRTSLAPWLHTVALRRALNRVRSETRRQQREDHFAKGQAQSTEVALDDLMDHLDAAIADLPERLRGPVIARYLEGRSYEAIAQEWNVAESTVRYRTNKGVERIRSILRRRGIPVAAGALAVTLSQQGAQAASASLTATLGKLAICGTTAGIATQAGGGAAAATSLGTLGGVLAMKKIVVAVVLVAVALAGYWALTRPNESPNTDKRAAIPEDVKAKLRDLEPNVGETTQDIQPVLVTSSVAAPAEEGVIDEAQTDAASEDEASAPEPASISGTVLDVDGNPIAGAFVDLTVGACVKEANKIRILEGAATYSATAGSDGAYRIDNIVHFGDIELVASAEGHVSLMNGVRYRKKEESTSLKRISAGGEYENADFRLLPAAAVIAGRVVNEGRTPVPGARIVLEKQLGEFDSQGWRYAVSDEAGQFEMPLPSDSVCVLVVRKEGYGAGYFDDIRPSVRDLELVLRKGGAIAGRAMTTANTAITGRMVSIMAEEEPGDVGNPWMGAGWYTVVTDDEGNYRLDDLSPDFTYTVRLPFRVPDGTPLRDTVQDLSDFVERKREIAEGLEEMRFELPWGTSMAEQNCVEVHAGRTTNVDLVADKRAAQSAVVYGRVTDPSTYGPVCPLAVSLFLPGFEQPVLAMACTERDGSFRMEVQALSEPVEVAVKAGYYYAPHDLGNGLYKNVEAQATVTTFVLEPGSEQEVSFSMPAPVTVPVRCVSTSGEPAQDVVVHWIAPNADGHLTLYGLAPHMTHQLEAMSDTENGYVPRGSSAPFSGRPGETLPEVEIVCDFSHGAFVGQLVLPEGIDECPVRFLNCLIYYEGRRHVYQKPSVTPEGFVSAEEVAPGFCSILLYMPTTIPDEKWWALIENVEIVADQTTDLGAIVPNPPALEE